MQIKTTPISSAVMNELCAVERMLLPMVIPAFAFYLITGYGVTQWSFLPRKIMLYLHLAACSMFAALILLHLIGRARTTLARNKIAGSKVDAALLIMFVLMLALLIWMEFI